MSKQGFFFSLGRVGTGTATIQTSDLWTVTDSMTDDVTGRKTVVTITDGQNRYDLVNIFAPGNYDCCE